ncbi:MAG: hypothetical protein H6737_12440 [Alphaproteobacteria bacterium]|nr:hypothetical protein [Alphaproteobacteria bacterium]
MRGFLFTTAASLGLALGTTAFADPGPEDEPAEDSATAASEAPATDCSTLEGDAKTICEEAAAEKPADEAEKDEAKGKGAKAKRSNTNRMERVHEDE